MKKHVKVYFDFFGFTKSDFIPCENCGSIAVDIHHLIFKSQLGKDIISNLMALCRECHNKAHASKEFNNNLKLIHDKKRDNFI